MRLIRLISTQGYLLGGMIRRDLSSSFAGTSLGGLWALLNPAIMLGLYSLVFSRIYRVGAVNGVGFTEFVFCALWPWMAFQDGCIRATGAVIDNASVVKRLQFPSELFVVSLAVSTLIAHGVGFVLFIVIFHLLGLVNVSLSLPLIIVPVTLQLVLTVGLGCVLACANVFFRDIGQIAGPVFTAWFFLTPILYPATMIPKGLRPLLSLNPMTPIVDLYRSVILSVPPPSFWLIGYSAAVALVLVLVGTWGFERSRGFFADYL